MIAIRLATREGAEVSDVLIPPFQKLPEVLVWGERFFSFHQELHADGEANSAEYREVFAYWIPPGEVSEEEVPPLAAAAGDPA